MAEPDLSREAGGTARVALVGAGFIARTHAEALRAVPGARLTAVIDPVLDRASALARREAGVAAFASVTEALAADAFDRAHVLVPPQHHRAVTETLLAAGKPVLAEKPLAASGAECTTLIEAAAAMRTPLGVNQNFVHHPAFVRLRAMITTGALGEPNHVDCLYHVPLRQMASRQFGHWMFQAAGNLLLEQAVHPLSQIAALTGPIGEARVLAGPPFAISSSQAIYPRLDATLSGAHLPAFLRFAVGESFPFWQLRVTCDDGVVVADILSNRCFAYRRTRWLEAVDGFVSGGLTAGSIFRDSAGNLLAYARAMLRLGGNGDPFLASMRGSIGAFHRSLDTGGALELDGPFGAMLVTTCERLRDEAFSMAKVPVTEAVPTASNAAGTDVAILGGTGFIGTHLVRRCLDAGLRIRVMARSTAGLADVFRDPRVTLQRGDIGDADAVAAAIAGVPVVVNLAHGGASGGFEEIRAAMVGGAENVARACIAAGAERLVHVGSIASLYLGPQPDAVTGATPPDPKSGRRGDYARAKAICDRMLLDMHAREQLPVVILRPGLVVGEGTTPFHSGLGLFNNEQHCIGWNAGRNPLPFVLVDDVAEAILAVTRSEGIDGRSYNLVGDVRLTARQYLTDLAGTLGRPLRFHPGSATRMWLTELAKWLIKRAGGRATPLPSLRDFRSRGMEARFDCTDAKRDLDWQPVSDPPTFRERAIVVHAG